MCIAQLLVVCLVLPGNKIQEPGLEMQQLDLVAQESSKKPQKTAIIYTWITQHHLRPGVLRQNISFGGRKKPQKTAKNRRPP